MLTSSTHIHTTGDAELVDGNNGGPTAAGGGCFPEAAVNCVCAADTERLLQVSKLLVLFDIFPLLLDS